MSGVVEIGEVLLGQERERRRQQVVEVKKFSGTPALELWENKEVWEGEADVPELIN